MGPRCSLTRAVPVNSFAGGLRQAGGPRARLAACALLLIAALTAAGCEGPGRPTLTEGPGLDAGVGAAGDAPPTWPSGAALVVDEVGARTVLLRFPPAQDDHGITGYRVYRDGVLWQEAPAPEATRAAHAADTLANGVVVRVKGLTRDAACDLAVEAVDTADQVTADRLGAAVRTKSRPTLSLAAQDAALGSGVPPFSAEWGFVADGPDPVQFDVAEGALVPRRASHLFGAVRTSGAGGGLADVRVEVLAAPELGYTLTDASGRFDLLVNGGGWVVVRFTKAGYPEVQRRIHTRWHVSRFVSAVALTPLDAEASEVHLDGGAAGVEVARGSVTHDGDGARRATVLFAPRTEGTMHLRDGSTRPLPRAVHVRATELTVGADGGDAMPGDLPAHVGYSYAVELGADEADAAGATDVTLSEPASVYVESFVGAPVGAVVPVGRYDRALGVWVPTADGIVLEIAGVDADGRAELDLDGDGVAEDAAELARFGFTSDELERVATLYERGRTLVRMPIERLAPYAWGFGRGREDGRATEPLAAGDEMNVEDSTCGEDLSVPCETKTRGADFAVAGSAARLHAAGPMATRADDPLYARFRAEHLVSTGDEARPRDALRERRVTLDVAGRRFCSVWRSDLPNGGPVNPADEGCDGALELSEADGWRYASTRWDGRDAAGRVVDAPVRAYARTCLSYASTEARAETLPELDATGDEAYVPAPFASFAVWSAATDSEFALDREGAVYTVCDDQEVRLGAWRGGEQGLLGLTVAGSGAYDARAHTLYRADGSVTRLGDGVIERAAQVGAAGDALDDGTPLIDAEGDMTGATVGPDGTIYVAFSRPYPDPSAPSHQAAGGAIYRVDPETATLQRVAGGAFVPAEPPDGTTCSLFRCARYDDQGAPAASTAIPVATALTLSPDGELYFADGVRGVVWKIDDVGRLQRVAGVQNFAHATGEAFHRAYETDAGIGDVVPGDPDSGDPLKAHFGNVSDLAFAPDGVLYIADMHHSRIRYINHDGRIRTLLRYRAVDSPVRVVVTHDGAVAERSLYDYHRVLFKVVEPDGWTRPVMTLPFAGSASPGGYEGDGYTTAHYASSPDHWGASGLGLDPSGRLLFMWTGRLIRMENGERLFAIAGNGDECTWSDFVDGPATAGCMASNSGQVEAAPDGSVYLLASDGPYTLTADAPSRSLYRWLPSAADAGTRPHSEAQTTRVTDAGRGVRYDVDARGRTLARFALDGDAVEARFRYDDDGELEAIVGADGGETRVERSPDGREVALVAPSGERTTLYDDDGDGRADRLVDAAGDTTPLAP